MSSVKFECSTSYDWLRMQKKQLFLLLQTNAIKSSDTLNPRRNGEATLFISVISLVFTISYHPKLIKQCVSLSIWLP
jgi:hypothetical protein